MIRFGSGSTRKLVSMAIVLALLLVGGVLPATAETAVTVHPRVFGDIAQGHWAEKAVAEMKAKGVVAGVAPDTFGGSNNVTREQVIVMLLRVLDLENDAAGKTIPSTFKNPGLVSSWAVPSVALAVEKGIITGNDLLEFRPAQPAKRYEVAVLTARAMGLSAEAELKTGAALPFVDAKDVPQPATGYVDLINEKGIMSGSEGTFKPLAPVNRYEIAIILSRIDFLAKEFLVKEKNGSILGINAPDLAVTLSVPGQGQVAVAVNPFASIFKDNERISLTELEPGYNLKVVMSRDQEAVYLEVLPEQALPPEPAGPVELSGTLAAVSFIPAESITVTADEGQTREFSLDPAAVIKRNGVKAVLRDLQVADAVDLEVLGNTVKRIYASQVTSTVEGIIQAVTIAAVPAVTIATADGQAVSYDVAADAAITLGAAAISVNQVPVGASARLELQGNRVARMSLEARQVLAHYIGIIENINGNAQVLSLREQGAADARQVFVTPATFIIRFGAAVQLEALKPGDEVFVAGQKENGFFTASAVIITSSSLQ